MTVFDSSALLAYLRGEPGAALVEAALAAGGACGAANWSEVAQKIQQAGASWATAKAVLTSYPLRVEPVTAPDAEAAAGLWAAAPNLSLADRLCLALANRLNAPALTADQAWGDARHGTRVDLIR
ncbi:MAG: PIN domain-containing protein [Bifidobacteriaceae bacterium]|jgi:PIN domain nuclease of toxin-antitoxin system|nr:PIN domain-containing protein [Bifidobacteriaceae bacterium]